MRRLAAPLLASALLLTPFVAFAQDAGQSVTPTAALAADPVDLSGLWVVSNRSARGALDENLQPLTAEQYLTPAGTEALASVRPALDPSAMCLPAMPRHIPGPYPIEIVQRPGRVAMLFEWDTVFRLIYTDGRGHPDPLDDQRYMGHAVGQWQGSELHVDTANFNGKAWLEGSGLPMSDQAHLTERYWLEDNGQTMRVVIRVADPVYLSRPIWRSYYFNLRNDWYIREYLCAEGNRDNVFQQREGELGSLTAEDVIETGD